MVEYLELSIADMILDEDNPRLGSVGNQSEALERIIGLNSSHFRSMMLSIKNDGLDPGDNLYVVEAGDGDYTVLEGFYNWPEYTEARKLPLASTEGTVTEGFVPPQQ